MQRKPSFVLLQTTPRFISLLFYFASVLFHCLQWNSCFSHPLNIKQSWQLVATVNTFYVDSHSISFLIYYIIAWSVWALPRTNPILKYNKALKKWSYKMPFEFSLDTSSLGSHVLKQGVFRGVYSWPAIPSKPPIRSNSHLKCILGSMISKSTWFINSFESQP